MIAPPIAKAAKRKIPPKDIPIVGKKAYSRRIPTNVVIPAAVFREFAILKNRVTIQSNNQMTALIRNRMTHSVLTIGSNFVKEPYCQARPHTNFTE